MSFDRRIPLALALACAPAALAAASCSNTVVTVEPCEAGAGIDAALVDAAVDSGQDAPLDAGNDASDAADAQPGAHVIQVAAGEGHTCALIDDGTVKCWGRNPFGELGDGTNAGQPCVGAFEPAGIVCKPVPQTVKGLTSATKIAVGGYTTCAITRDKTVWCWGNNSQAELGDGTTTNRFAPVQALGVTNAVDLAAAEDHVCALLEGGDVMCWGGNGDGQLGLDPGDAGDAGPPIALVPVRVPSLAGSRALVAGARFTCALAAADGSVSCVGYNWRAELANGTRDALPHPSPSKVPGITGAKQLAAGYAHACALKGDGSAVCWGYNTWSENGTGAFDGTTGCGDPSDTCHETPVPVTVVSGVTRLYPSFFDTCATLAADDQLHCWGRNDDGELGIGDTSGQRFPLTPDPDALVQLTASAVHGIGPFTSVAMGYEHACVLQKDGAVMCWGLNDLGQLGNDTNGLSCHRGYWACDPVARKVLGLP